MLLGVYIVVVDSQLRWPHRCGPASPFIPRIGWRSRSGSVRVQISWSVTGKQRGASLASYISGSEDWRELKFGSIPSTAVLGKVRNCECFCLMSLVCTCHMSVVVILLVLLVLLLCVSSTFGYVLLCAVP